LLSNANKFTSKGNIIIRAKCFRENHIKITVVDSGTGIQNNYLKKLGMLTNSRESKLIGLGLTIANYLASLISPIDRKGIFVSTKSGRGSVFAFFVENIPESKLKRSNISSSNHYTECE
jgi:signal transduction histidine kinase